MRSLMPDAAHRHKLCTLQSTTCELFERLIDMSSMLQHDLQAVPEWALSLNPSAVLFDKGLPFGHLKVHEKTSSYEYIARDYRCLR